MPLRQKTLRFFFIVITQKLVHGSVLSNVDQPGMVGYFLITAEHSSSVISLERIGRPLRT